MWSERRYQHGGVANVTSSWHSGERREVVGGEGDAAMTHEELLHGRPARISTRSTNGTPRTTCGAVLPGTEPNRHVPANRRFYGARTRERLRRRTVTVDAPIRLSFFVFVIRRSNNPAAGRAEEGGRWTARARRATACASAALAARPCPLRTLAERYADTGYENRIYAAKPARIRAIAPALAGNGRSSSTRAAAPPAGAPGARARARSESTIVRSPRNTNYQKLATFLTHLTTSRRYLDTHKLQQSLQQKTQRKGACPRVRGCV